MLQEAYRIHGGLVAKNANGILKATIVSSTNEQKENEFNDSYRSTNYHPKRIIKYSVNTSHEDNQLVKFLYKLSGLLITISLVFLWKSFNNSITMKEPKEFKRRSLGLIKDDANQVSDLRLL